jgi:hypothetical protein
MEEKPVIASMSGEVVLSIEDIKDQASKKLPATARGERALEIFLLQSCTMSLSSRLQPFIYHERGKSACELLGCF